MHTLACYPLPPQDVSGASALPVAVVLTELDSMRRELRKTPKERRLEW